ncbi:Methyl-accepting chemotaxis protein McpQ [Fundidesulfovibrio magnetotacticus]|uniref:Methyl-accepting chemotaxis protein McpQ n=1 Tax=Fundidesulfovibrio magnetotacticus TaxID=2730080 RepID=A0A6V8LU73_9BACT|nr:methyl-accepting chemotaxis protein [Fundidesulfovibrio magnetotacticus]GFK93659.1 Methyl-accepting chemotaxis protein McpQ [Fundidesulfovibrio magnetotacticus]
MFANLKIRYKLGLLLVLPLTAFFIYSGIASLDKYEGWKSASVMMEAVDVMVRLGGLAHELQKERGLSSGFLASKGERFGPELNAQRGASNAAVSQLRDTLTRSAEAAKQPSMAKALAALEPVLSGLDGQRASVDAKRLEAREAIGSYTQSIDKVLGGCSVILTLAAGSGMTRPAAAYVELLRGKEAAGQERALLNGAFSAGRFTPELYKDWLSRLGVQDAHLGSFATLGGDQATSLLASRTEGPAKEVDAFRAKAFANQAKPALEGDPQAWFKASTVRIDALKAVEDAWSSSLTERCTGVLEKARGAFFLNLGAALGVALVSLLLGWLVFRSITGPLLGAVDFAQHVASGDLGVSIDAKGGDEVAALRRALGSMLETIRAMIDKAEKAMQEASREAEHAREAALEAQEATARAERAKSEGMAMAADKLEGVVLAVTTSSEQLASEVEQASGGASLQSARMAETATAMEQMNATVLEVARSASAAAATSDKARQEALNGAKVVREAMVGITQARDQSLELKRAMGELEGSARDVGRILSVISDIADQTNLLALNAAIEAARAGEAGRGFAVVADEVRKLAEKTMQATKEVASSVGGIQQGAADTIRNVESAVARIESATAQADLSGKALEAIVSLVDEASMQVSSIATASEEQSASSEEINRSLEDVNRISMETAQAMDHSAQAVSGLAAQSRTLRGLIGELRAS